ncbi:MAG TPA: EamA family transporter [Thermoplasmata archaeon]|jgi:drug/metabolite transporter (DMT)-like permease
MELWLVYALLTVVFYGLGEGLSKEPTVRLGSGRMLALYAAYSVPIYAGWFFLFNGFSGLNSLGIGYAVASALCGTAGNALWFLAMEWGNASVVSGFTAAYPVITVAAAVIGLGATLLPVQIVAIAFLLAGSILLGLYDEPIEGPRDRRWIVPMMIAVLLWGAWGVFEKLAIASIGFAGNAGIYVLVSTPIFLAIAWKDHRSRPKWDWTAVRSAQPTLLLFAIAGVTIFLAIGLGPLAVVVPLTTAYPIVAIAVRRFWMEERMTLPQKIAVGLAIVGAALASL